MEAFSKSSVADNIYSVIVTSFTRGSLIVETAITADSAANITEEVLEEAFVQSIENYKNRKNVFRTRCNYTGNGFYTKHRIGYNDRSFNDEANNRSTNNDSGENNFTRIYSAHHYNSYNKAIQYSDDLRSNYRSTNVLQNN
ncbi:Hypp7040 [Branchiostoma lanceolatum]|uniref:Hypp7040 protein n=1 Tax=Branchiostoma lanceolatum TaxID=7740 RepID=A0A8J9YWG5_BRALA|nr:Hypp7040 [Branchiostoma lanceolatum]